MNDRFKFRVWNKHINEYCDIQNLFILPTGEIGYFITDGSYPHQRKFMHQEDMIIEMCTGLKDKNGNLIYDGDVVRYSYGSKGIVSFGKYTGCFAVGWENIYQNLIGLYLDDYYGSDYNGRLKINHDYPHSSITEEDVSDFEIIGNVHEQTEQKDVK